MEGVFDAWLESLDRVYRDVRDDGYHAYTEGRCSCKYCLGREVAVDIDRNGELLFVAGRHRLAIAKLLGLSEIPVVVVVRHHEFVTGMERESRASTRSESAT